tara:strand:- start:4282 stop:4470 length:189 start_codon:yes stop_codon:yes gene_type:complete
MQSNAGGWELLVPFMLNEYRTNPKSREEIQKSFMKIARVVDREIERSETRAREIMKGIDNAQ